jgi:2-polyprenyl-3-methyl-5-hydroxy-6-metoxy-1,4-benzoquinol methylase
MTQPSCRFCAIPLQHTFVNLGMSPLCESFLSADHLNQMEPFFPLHVWVCGSCFLVQLEEYVSVEHIFSDYAYFSSYSDSWLKHAENYTNQMVKRFGLDSTNLVVELASNDGYLLQYFVKKGIPVLGIEPAANVAEVAVQKGVRTQVRFFNRETARELAAQGQMGDLLLGNNVLAQVPDINSFVAGMKILLKPQGVITMEFPHLTRLMQENQFDTIYHEHFSYFSLWTAEKIFAAHGIVLFDVEELQTHGGSLRIYGRHADDLTKPVTERLDHLRAKELAEGVNGLESYTGFSERVKETKRKVLEFLIHARREGKTVAAYGAPGKGNTLLNYCGIRTDFIDYAVDRNPHKHGKFLPGTHIPIFAPERIRETRPDYLFILPWNLKKEIMEQNGYIRDWGGRFVVPIPHVQVFE